MRGERNEARMVGWALAGVWALGIAFSVGVWYLGGWLIGFF